MHSCTSAIKQWNKWRPFQLPFHPLFYCAIPLAVVYFFFPQYYLLKAAPVWCWALSCYYHNKVYYTKIIALGLFFGSIGDILLEMKAHYDVDLFIAGLLAFLVGHICYIRSFYHLPLEKSVVYVVLPIVLCYYVVVMVFLLPNASYLLIAPIAIYGFVLSMMLFFAMNRMLMRDRLLFWTRILALIGSIFFVSSDTILSFHTFYPGGDSIPFSGYLIMITYYVGQLCIASSTQVPIEVDAYVDHITGMVLNPENEFASTFVALVG